MTILQKIISELESDDRSQQIKILCDRIQNEESKNIIVPERLPKGPNIFLALSVPGKREDEIGYLTLERETSEIYLVIFSTLKKVYLLNMKVGLKRQKVWEVNDNRPEKILTTYARTYKFLRGE